MLAPATLLDALRTCTVFMDTDAGRRIKVVCRYQQYRAARKIVERLRAGKTPESRSGVVWHTQGSGKSLTMVFVARMLRAAPDLEDFKIILVNDRWIWRTRGHGKLIGGKAKVIEHRNCASTWHHVRHQHGHGAQVHGRTEVSVEKVAEALISYRSVPSSKTFGVVNPSERSCS